MMEESFLPTSIRKTLPLQLETIKNGCYTPDHKDYPIHKYLQEQNLLVDENGSEIVNFFKGKSILITGATGFLGKLLVEKLLRSCKDIKNIYLIIRSKKAKSTETRIKEYLDSWIFLKLSEMYPNFREKVIGINGDLEKVGLDLTEESRKLITDKVNIIYHVGATVRFNEKLRTSVMININGAREIVRIAKECNKLDVLCHVSTAFSNCNQRHVEEKFYEPYVDGNELLYLIAHLSDNTLDKITPGLIGNLPNTYVFSKQIAEDLVRLEAVGIPTCILRPSIVVPTFKEPLPLWSDSSISLITMMHSGGLGHTHIFPGNINGIVNLVPADYVINQCIAASYKTATDKKSNEIPIYNCTSAETNSLSWRNVIRHLCKGTQRVGSTNVIFKPFITFTTHSFLYLFLILMLHYIPAFLADCVMFITGKKQVYIEIYSKITKSINVVSYFSLNEWTFNLKNTKELWQSLNEKDQRNFSFNMETLNWNEYWDLFLLGCREHISNEFLDNLDEGRAHYKKVIIFSNIFIATVTLLSVYYLINTIFCFIPLIFISMILYYKFN